MSDTLLPVSGVEFCPTWMLWENDALEMKLDMMALK